MEFLLYIIAIVLFLLVLVSPILLYLKLYKDEDLRPFVFVFMGLGLLTSTVLVWTTAWWLDYSNEILLSWYGYDSSGMHDALRTANVSPENLSRVRQLESSGMGFGWSLMAVIGNIMIIPYIILVYLVCSILTKSYQKPQKSLINE